VLTKRQVRALILQRHGYVSGRNVLDGLPWQVAEHGIADGVKLLLEGRERLLNVDKRHRAGLAADMRRQELSFALDGRLLGDIGELIAEREFDLRLLGRGTKDVDAETTMGPRRRVQIKVSLWGESLSIKHGNHYLLGLQLDKCGRFRVVYNGPARLVLDYIRTPRSEGRTGRRGAGTRLERVTLGTWATLNLDVRNEQRIPLRAKKGDAMMRAHGTASKQDGRRLGG